MTIYKSTKIGLAAAAFAVVAQLTSGVITNAPDTAATTITKQASQDVKTNIVSTRCSVRLGRDFSESRSDTLRLSRAEAMEAEHAACETAKTALAEKTAAKAETTASISAPPPPTAL